MADYITWKLPKTLFESISKEFEVINSEKKDNMEILSWRCVKRDGWYYCEKWVNGALITRGPFDDCPANCEED